jgi:UMF1 family MFS transporter
MTSNSIESGFTDGKVLPGPSVESEHHSSLHKDKDNDITAHQHNGNNNHGEEDNLMHLTRRQRLHRKLFWDDPRDEQELQPQVEEKLVKKKEIWGFLLFGFGYYTYNNTCQSLLLPILIQGVARGAAHLESNWDIMCPAEDSDIPAGDRCLVPFGWIRVTTTSYVLLTNVVLTWCAVVCSLGVSAVADHGRRSKKLTLFFTAMMCFISCFMFMGALWPSIWWFCGLNFVIGKQT